MLDPVGRREVMTAVRRLNREEGMTVVTATHDLEIVQEIADRAVVFSEAHSIVGEGTPAEVLANREQLLECNLLHEHRHRHGDVTHRHEHLHRAGHSHQ